MEKKVVSQQKVLEKINQCDKFYESKNVFSALVRPPNILSPEY